jgi:hypothetical protein
MRLIDNCIEKPNQCEIGSADNAFEAVGLSQKNALEFTSQNLADFNKVAENAHGVDYFSIGSHKERLQCSDLLRQSHEFIVGGSKDVIGGNRNDGLVRPEEAQHGRYLLTVPEHDHLEIVGFNANNLPHTVFNMVVDNLRLQEIKDDPAEARMYGVDHFFHQTA